MTKEKMGKIRYPMIQYDIGSTKLDNKKKKHQTVMNEALF